MRYYILRIILFACLLRLVYFGTALLVAQFDKNLTINLSFTEFVLLSKRADSFWYQKAADQGYPQIHSEDELGYTKGKVVKQSVWAHFPMYPLTIRAGEKIFHLDFDNSAFIFSWLFSLSGFIAFFLLCIHVFRISIKDGYLYTLFFMFFPFHYYYSMYYTEALFFTALALSFVCINRKKYIITSLLLIPLVLVRPNGIVSLIPLFLYFMEVEFGYSGFLKKLKDYDFKPLLKTLLFVSGPLALLAYMIFQHHMTGYYMAFAKAQAGWGKEWMFPLMGLFRRSDLASQFNSVYSLVFMAIAVVAWKKLPVSMNVLIWISILLPLSSGSALCMPRYISTIFPITIFLASLVTGTRYWAGALITLLVLQLVTFYPWIISHPFSF